MRVAVLPTGRMEWLALPAALQRLFPEHEFYAVPERELYDSKGPYSGFTSVDLSKLQREVGEHVTTLVGRAAQEVLKDRRKSPADLVVILEDLELSNVGNEEGVAKHFRAAVETHLQSFEGGIAQRTATAIRERVSFHLAVPMIEAWLFADGDAPRRAGVPLDRPPRLKAEAGVEAFETDDPSYDAACPEHCPKTRWDNKKSRPKWSGNDRHRHPKGYLQWLCHDSQHKDCTTYSETIGGAKALQDLAWGRVLQRQGIAYLSAMLEDLGYELGGDTFQGLRSRISQCAADACTSITRAPHDKVLRNL